MNITNSKYSIRHIEYGFTIIELLVTIVIVGILASVTLASYSGIQTRVATTTLKSDLKNASTQLNMDNVTNSSYPASQDAANGGKGLSKSTGTVYQYIATTTSYCVSATSTAAGSGNSYRITSANESIQSGVCAMMWKQISSSQYHTCGIASDDLAYCWGSNGIYGGLGNNSTAGSLVPVAVDRTGVLSGKTIKSISAAVYRTCAIASDDLAYCWGDNRYGQLGNNSTTESFVPVAVDRTGALSGKTIKSISANGFHTCAIASDNLAYCWGYNFDGELGNSSNTQSNVPFAVDRTGLLSGKTMKSIALGTYHTCAIASDDLTYCWGYSGNGELGNNTNTWSYVPVLVDRSTLLSGKTMKQISLGSRYSCGVASDNLAYCWGLNTNGALGNNSTTESWVPVAVNVAGVLSGKTFKSVAADYLSTCAIASDDLAYCWGNNGNGRLGNNSTAQSLVPVQVSISGLLSGKTVSSLTTGYFHGCVIASDSLAYCWGNNALGRLGNNSTVESWVPITVVSP